MHGTRRDHQFGSHLALQSQETQNTKYVRTDAQAGNNFCDVVVIPTFSAIPIFQQGLEITTSKYNGGKSV